MEITESRILMADLPAFKMQKIARGASIRIKITQR